MILGSTASPTRPSSSPPPRLRVTRCALRQTTRYGKATSPHRRLLPAGRARRLRRCYRAAPRRAVASRVPSPPTTTWRQCRRGPRRSRWPSSCRQPWSARHIRVLPNGCGIVPPWRRSTLAGAACKLARARRRCIVPKTHHPPLSPVGRRHRPPPPPSAGVLARAAGTAPEPSPPPTRREARRRPRHCTTARPDARSAARCRHSSRLRQAGLATADEEAEPGAVPVVPGP